MCHCPRKQQVKRSGCPAGGRVGFGPTESFKAYMQKPSLFRENGSSLRAATFIQHIPSLILCTYYSFWNPCSRNILKICNERRDFVARPWKDKNSLETKLKKTAISKKKSALDQCREASNPRCGGSSSKMPRRLCHTAGIYA